MIINRQTTQTSQVQNPNLKETRQTHSTTISKEQILLKPQQTIGQALSCPEMDVYQKTVMRDTLKLLNVYNTFLQNVQNQSDSLEQL